MDYQNDEEHDPLASRDNARSSRSATSTKFAGTEYRDKFWTCLFFAQFIAVVVAGIYLHYRNKSLTVNNDFTIQPYAWQILVATSLISFGCTFFWMMFIRTFPHIVIRATFLFFIMIEFVISALYLYYGLLLVGILISVCGFLSVLAYYGVEHRVNFSAVIMVTIVDCLNKFYGTLYLGYMALLLQVGWLVLWSVCFVAIIQSLRNDNSNTTAAFIFLLLSFYWTAELISSILHVTVAGTVATWYFYHPQSIPSHPSLSSFKRASTMSFGSSCLSSLFLSLVRVFHHMMTYLANKSQNVFVQCCVHCLMDLLQSIVSWVNIYALTQVAIYGRPFCESSKAAWELITRGGFDAMINDVLIRNVLMAGSILIGLTCGTVAIFMVKIANQEDLYLMFTIAFLIGFILSMCVMQLISSASTAFFVCLAEDLQAFRNNHPELYDDVVRPMKETYRIQMHDDL